MAVLIDKKDEAAVWHKRRNEMVKLINHELWDEKSGFYYDNGPDGKLIKIKTEAGFTPLLAGVCNKQQAEALVKHLTNPDEFWRAFPVPSVSGDEPTFSDNMWRGPVWINYNYMIIEGLERYDYHDLAGELRRKTLDEIMRWYKEDGVVYEFYDSEGKTSPIFLHRKKLGGPDVRRPTSLGTTICDYNWTAALFIDLMTR
jgi:neutral trehalase